MSDQPQWGRRADDYRSMTNSISASERAERRLQRGVHVLLAMAMLTMAATLVVAWRAGEKVQRMAAEAELASQRNTELLSVKCDLTTGEPIPRATGRYVNTAEFLGEFCRKQKEQAETVSGYITQIKDALRTQLENHDHNTDNRHDRIEAMVQRHRAPAVSRRPIGSSSSTAAPSSSSDAVASPSAPAPSTTTVTTAAPPAPVTTVCPTKGKRPKECR